MPLSKAGSLRKLNPYQPRRSGHIRFIRYHLFKFLAAYTLPLTLVLIVSIIGLFLWYSRDLPQPDKVKRQEGFSTVLYDRNNQPLYDIYADKDRKLVQLNDIPDNLKKATIAIEDKDFYKHQGFDPKGILRAFLNILTLHGIQGGSTLTQQLVKNSLLTSEQTLPRKIKEFVLAVQIERKYKKDEILQMYLNEAPYGGTMWGIESAAQGYFGKSTKDLSLLESAILAGLPQRPSFYSPLTGNTKAYIGRTEEVLRRMREDGYITGSQEFELKKQLPNVTFNANAGQFRAPHFVLYVKKQLEDMFGAHRVENEGLKVVTTLDWNLQDKVEKIVAEEIDKLKDYKVSNGAAVVINPQTGEILSYIGSKDYDAADDTLGGKFDVVSMGYRQPGSALKPITYAVALMKGYTPATMLMDVETSFPGGTGKPDYKPQNYDGKFHGPIQLRFALGNSINIPAVKLTAMVGIPDILKLANDMGISTLAPTKENEEKFGLSITLGGGEVRLLDLTSAYGVFATGGTHNDPYSIVRVTDQNGSVLYEHKPVTGKKVLGEDISFLISHMLLDNNARKDVFGPNSYLVVPGKTVSVKTGTTDDKRDNWTVGYTKSFVTGVWVGNNDNSAMSSRLASGITGAAPIWNRIMKEALKNKSDEEPDKPDNVISMDVDAYGGDGLPHAGKPTRTEYFISGTEPKAESAIYQKLKVSKKDNTKLANDIDIAAGDYDEKDFIVIKENDPTSDGTRNRWQEGIDAWMDKQPDPMYHPPRDTAQADENRVVVRIKKPDDKTKTDSNTLDVEATSKAVKDIKRMELYVDDNLKTKVENNSLTETLNLDTGIHKIKVKAYDTADHSGDSEIQVAVKTDFPK